MTQKEAITKIITNELFDSMSSGTKFNIDGVIYKVKFGRDKYACSEDAVELQAKTVDICCTGDRTAFYILTPEYKSKIQNVEDVIFIGEFRSKYINDKTERNFGFGHKASGLTKYTISDFIKG